MNQDENSTLSQDEKIKLKAKTDNQSRIKAISITCGSVLILALLYFVFTQLSAMNNTDAEQATTQPDVVNAQVNSEEAREAFKNALTQFEQEIQPYLENVGLANWAGNEHAQLIADKDALIASFASGSYATALTQLEALSQNTASLVAKWEAAFAEAMQQAQEAFDQDRINLSQLSLQKAIDINPEAPETSALQSRIDAYAKVSELVKTYKVGVAENNLEKQINALRSALQLDPQRTDLQPLLASAEADFAEQTLKNALSTAQQAIAEKDYSKAISAYQTAQAIAPERDSVKALGAQLAKINQQVALTNTLNSIAELAKNDQWQEVLSQSTQGLRTTPNNTTLADMKEKATAILAMQSKLQGFIARPARLTDERIQSQAKSTLKEAIPLMKHSASLTQDMKTLGGLVKDMGTPIDLTVTSDNRTHIIVKGEGIIGKTRNKTVALPPGTYTLEATREGYRSKMLTVTLSPNQPAPSVHLVCDQKI
ncbi:hypothetical protein [Alteromonas sp. a30]|uniref:hypothetical protein n=1 Tax=Alteromonas sp. a30 TaxID=2730917 RepID=UPI0022802357|nr:hypothetical protein [Alteromonas sp. a30]MCY7296908.1 hypothetical protein [Alteromonas sp. a30]